MRRPTFPPPGGSGAAAAAASLPSPPAAALLLAAEEAVAPPPGPPFFPPPFPPVSHREARGGRPVFLSRLLTAGLPHRRSPRARGAASPQAARGAHFPPPSSPPLVEAARWASRRHPPAFPLPRAGRARVHAGGSATERGCGWGGGDTPAPPEVWGPPQGTAPSPTSPNVAGKGRLQPAAVALRAGGCVGTACPAAGAAPAPVCGFPAFPPLPTPRALGFVRGDAAVQAGSGELAEVAK